MNRFGDMASEALFNVRSSRHSKKIKKKGKENRV